MVLAGHFERGGEGERAAGYYLRAAEQSLHVLDPDATMVRANLGLGCAPPPELRISLVGMRCEASSYRLHQVNAMMADAEELLRSAPRGSTPWAQGIVVYIQGTLMAGRTADLLAAFARLGEVEPAPEAMGRMALALLISIFLLDNFGQVADGTALEDRFRAIVHADAERDPTTVFWWNVAIGMRASYAHDDPWSGLVHSDALQAIFDATGGEIKFLNMHLFQGLNLWFLGASAAAEQHLEEIVAMDEMLVMVNHLRRFSLSWLRADRGALDDARTLATQLSEDGRARNNPMEEGRGRWVLAEVLRRTGDLAAAERELEAALAMAVPFERPGVLATLSALRIAQGRTGEALAAAEDAVARCTAMGGCGMFRGAFVRLAHAEALHATGAHDAARRAVTEARARLLAIADTIADPAYRQGFLDNVPENARTLALAHAWLGAP
jgi:hypothetical protein